MIDSHNIAAAARTTVRIPTPSGDEIEAWVYRPEGDRPHPAVVEVEFLHRHGQADRDEAASAALRVGRGAHPIA
jgi:dienelactone hydrolase